MTASALALRDLFPAPVGSLDQFIQAVHRAPYLSAAEERALARRLHDHNDLDAARVLVLSHLRYVVHMARRYVGYGLPMGDLVQEGSIGLMKAVRRFDPDRGVRLVSFAMHWIRAEIHEYVLRNWHILKIATTKAQRKLFFNLRRNKQRLAHLTREEAAAVGEKLGVDPADVMEMDVRLGERSVSFDPLEGDDDEAPAAPADYLADEGARPDLAVENSEWNDRQLSRLRGALETLDARSRDIVEARWLREEDKVGLKELGERYGVSAERVRQLEQQALRRLSQTLAA
jgi:RNA polymerase sigma-32 factor